MTLSMLMTLGVALAALVALMLIRVSIRQQIIETHVTRIDSMLTVWAKGWGDPPDKLRAELLALLTAERPRDRVIVALAQEGSDGSPAMGADFT